MRLFDYPVTICIPYSNSNVSTEHLKLMRFDEEKDSWIEVLETWIDTEMNLICCEINHFSTFQAAEQISEDPDAPYFEVIALWNDYRAYSSYGQVAAY